MVKLNEITQTATFAWSNEVLPVLATGSAAGVIDDDFSSNSSLSFYTLTSKDPKLSIEAPEKFQDLDWAKSNNLLAGALESGVIQFWNTEKLNSENIVTEAGVGKKHSGSIKSLQFNPIQHNVMVSGGSNSEIFIWDTNKLANLSPFAPGTAMTPMDTVTKVSWNNHVSHIFASAGTTGYTSIWDLKAKKEVLHLKHTSATGTRANLSTVEWHPFLSTKVVTASESDGVPVVLTWDLRNAKAPECILEGHKKGILSLDWNPKDPSLLLSSGKDNTTILWNPLTGTKLAQYPTTANWIFKTKFAPQSPDIFASASFDKKVVIQTLQDTSPPETSKINAATENEFWNQISDTETQQPEYFVKQAPSWYGRTSSVSFGFGGKLVQVSKTSEKSSTIKITKPNLPGSKENTELNSALQSNDFQNIIESHIKNSIDENSKVDWELLNELTDKAQVFDKFISLKINDEKKQEKTKTEEETLRKESDSNESDFFNKLEENTPELSYFPSGPFTLSDSLKELTQPLLSKDLETAVDVAIKNDKLTEALIIALNGSNDLKEKVRNVYFNKYAAKDPIARLLYSVSIENVSDLTENADVSNWREIANSIKTYAKDEESLKSEFIKLGDRILAEDPIKNRNDAIKIYINANALEKIAIIWIQELKELEAKLLSINKSSPYDAHLDSLTEFIEKFSAYRSVLKFNAPVIQSEKLLSVILEYTTIISTSGQFELANKFLSLLSDEIAEVKLEKARIAKASGFAKSAQGTTNGASNHGISRTHPNAYAPSVKRVNSSNPYTAQQPIATPAAPATQPMSANPYAQQTPAAQPSFIPGQPVSNGFPAVQAPNAYRPAAAPVAAPATANPYAPVAANPYKPAETPLPAGPIPGSSQPAAAALAPPPISIKKKTETDGWNDLPKQFQQQQHRTPAAAAKVVSPFAQPAPVNTSNGVINNNFTGPSPTESRTYANTPVMPPPPRSVSRTRKPSQIEDLPKPSPSSPKVNPRYTPSVSSPQVAPATFGGYNPTQFQQQQQPPIPGPPTGAQQPLQPAVNPYAPPPAATQTQPKPNPYAPPPAQPQHNFGTGNSQNGTPLTAAASLNQPQLAPPPQFSQPGFQQGISPPPQAPAAVSQYQTPPPKPSKPQPKYPSGDRSHIPESTLPIYQTLSAVFEKVKPRIPEHFSKQVVDTEKRLNILFDHLNNQDSLSESCLALLHQLVSCLESKDYSTALNLQLQLLTEHASEGGNWLVGIKRLIQFAEAVIQDE